MGERAAPTFFHHARMPWVVIVILYGHLNNVVQDVLSLSPHRDVTATLILDILEVAGHTMYTRYGKQFGKLLAFVKSQYFSKMETVKSEPGPTVRLDQFLVTAIRGGSIKEPDGALKPGFI